LTHRTRSGWYNGKRAAANDWFARGEGEKLVHPAKPDSISGSDWKQLFKPIFRCRLLFNVTK
jgi:hypothetical protein